MSELTIRGKVVEILLEINGVSKSGKEWKKQEFVIETIDKYPVKVCFTLFGDKTDLLSKISVGLVVDVSFNIESREYNERWFHNVNAWKIIIIEDESEEPKSANEVYHEKTYEQDKPPVNDAPPHEQSDLPF